MPEPVRSEWVLLPEPKQLEFTGGWLAVKPSQTAVEADATKRLIADALVLVSGSARTDAVIFGVPMQDAFKVDPAAVPQPEGYTLDISAKSIAITAHDEAGAFHAAQTLTQLARQAAGKKYLPCLRISDWPDFPHRGVMLDIARDKVPEMDTLYAFVDQMAEWKLNELQLYTEHTFAYKGHHVVWENASPMTPQQIHALDVYCREHFIELVPNQNSFGHMGRWLSHPEYAYLGEMTDGGDDLCPVEPRCITFLNELYDQLLPCFSSGQVNVGCDETWSLGKGRSATAVNEKGEGRVYLDFLLQIHQLVSAHGKRMQFWGDIINKHPELIPELPKDMIAIEWGYDADHPFERNCARYAAAGVPFYVAPGTSSWCSLLGRTENSLENLRNAAINGKANGAIGYLITDWGDLGHWQFLPVSYGPMAYGAAACWAYDAN